MSNQTKAAGGLSDPGRIKEVLSRHGFHFSKALGQKRSNLLWAAERGYPLTIRPEEGTPPGEVRITPAKST